MTGILLAQEHMSLISIHLDTIIFSLLNTLIVVLLYRFLLHKKVHAVLERRREKINAERDRLEKELADAERAHQENHMLLIWNKEESVRIIEQAVKEGKQKEEELVAKGIFQAMKIQEKAAIKIAGERKRAVSEAKKEIAGMVVSATEMLIHRELSEEDNEKLIENYLERVGK